MSTMQTDEFVSAAQNPALLASLAESAVQDDKPERRPEPPAELPPDTSVELPAGFLDMLTGDLLTSAEVRELNGADEEALAKVGSTNIAKLVDVILERGVVEIGGRPAKPLLDMLLSGDRDALFIGVRCATYGQDLELTAKCPTCDKTQEVVVDLNDDVPVRRLNDPKVRYFEVETRKGKAVISLPTGRTQRELLQAENKTAAELNTMVLVSCVQELNGQPVHGAAAVREGMGARDRETLLEAIGSRVPGPRLGEVSKPCQSCGESIALPLTLADLFRR